MPSTAPTERELEEIRRAAFELRESDPAQAVKILRRIAKRGGEVEALAQGALGEILLDDFDDVDGALHHFQRLVAIAPDVPAGNMGLARALGRKGEVREAQLAYVKAIAGLEQLVRSARSAQEEERPEGLDETVLTVLELAIEERDLLEDNHQGEPLTHPDEEVLQWAESVRLFDGDESDDEDIGLDDWLRFVFLRSMLAALDGQLGEALGHIDRLSALVSVPESDQHQIRSLIYEAVSDAASAANEALASVQSDPEAGPDDLLRTALLLSQQERFADAHPLLLRAQEALQSADSESEIPEEIRETLLKQIETLLEEMRPAGLVTLGGTPFLRKR